MAEERFSFLSAMMNVDPYTGALHLHGLEMAIGNKLKCLRASKPEELQHPLVSNGEFETYRLADDEAVSHLVFKGGQLWPVSTCLHLPKDAAGELSEACERLRNALHEAELQRLIGTTRLECGNGCVLETRFDPRSMSSVILATFPAPD